MPSNEQRRKAAKRKLDRQIERRAERARRRRRTIAIGSVVGVVVLVAAAIGVYFFVTAPADPSPAAAGSGACAYTAEGPPSRPVAQPDPNPAREGIVGLTLATSQGPIGLTLDRATAPCAVNAVTSLAQQGFYNDTPCHRLTTGEGLKVLQCGDPTGSGSGGPGFRYAEEPPQGLLPSPSGSSVYSRGLVAMAKTSQPDTTGSQFFLVYGDSELPPQYTVLGRIDTAGLAVLDRVAATGSDNSNGQGDGKPVTPVQIQTATVS